MPRYVITVDGENREVWADRMLFHETGSLVLYVDGYSGSDSLRTRNKKAPNRVTVVKALAPGAWQEVTRHDD
jgi:hypothetical protein